jgi:hypothetical protein
MHGIANTQPNNDNPMRVLETMKTIWRGWKAFVHKLVAAQSYVLMAFTYWVAVGPIAVFMKLRYKDLIDRGLGEPDIESYWQKPTMGFQDIRRAQRPW